MTCCVEVDDFGVLEFMSDSLRLRLSHFPLPPGFCVSVFISTAESALAGIAAPVPVGSAPAPSHTKHEPQLSCRACGTYLHGRNAPGSNLPIRHVPTPRRYAPDRPLDHRTWQLPRHD